MVHLQEIAVIDPVLVPYVEGYGLLRLNDTQINKKEILPWPGCFLLFVNQAFELDGRAYPFGCVRGLCDIASHLRWPGDTLEVFTVRFTPYGLRPFLKLPTNKSMQRAREGLPIWNSPLPTLFESVVTATALEAKVKMVEDFLVENLDPESIDSTDREIIRLADAIRRDPSEAWGPLRAAIPLGNRQFARRFSALIGVNLRTYVRICRFAHAKSRLLHSPTPSLTELGYDAGYFDQAHFSREFSALAKQSPKHFPGHYPLHRLISEEND